MIITDKKLPSAFHISDTKKPERCSGSEHAKIYYQHGTKTTSNNQYPTSININHISLWWIIETPDELLTKSLSDMEISPHVRSEVVTRTPIMVWTLLSSLKTRVHVSCIFAAALHPSDHSKSSVWPVWGLPMHAGRTSPLQQWQSHYASAEA
jgi:hypothetical protein